MRDLTLEPISNKNWRNALQVRTTPSQLEFVAGYEPVALVILAKSFVRAGNVDWHPFAITIKGETVGVVAITLHERRCEIFHLVVDRQHQGQGLGKASVALIVDYIRMNWPEVKTIALTVHPENKTAQHVYATCGFAPTGELKEAEPVMEMAI